MENKTNNFFIKHRYGTATIAAMVIYYASSIIISYFEQFSGLNVSDYFIFFLEILIFIISQELILKLIKSKNLNPEQEIIFDKQAIKDLRFSIIIVLLFPLLGYFLRFF